MAKRHVPYEIRFIALTRNANGTLSVYDIIETSYHYAGYFFRRFERESDVCMVDVYSRDNVHSRRVEFH